MAETGFLERTLEYQGRDHRYQVYVPVEYTPDRAWSVILFLHGSGEAGTDGVKQTEVGLGPAIRANPERFPALVVFPQVETSQGWRDQAADVALAALDQVLEEFHGDPQRIYLTGISMGGYGCWYLALKRPGFFAALSPVCGGLDMPDELKAGSLEEAMDLIGQTPVWMFHGAQDERVPVGESRGLVEKLKRHGKDVRYSEYPDGGHGIWDRAYNDPQWITWLLSQIRGAEEVQVHATEPSVYG